ncbi:MAG TPA: IPT/TIG domain-containing protein [Bryobacteraceae bacterium]|nr:IPT/TIG domain-containing protein [Bryobacteraceae bacterium]
MSYFFKFGVTACLCVAFTAQAQTISGVLSTVAGNATTGFAGDGGAALSANLNQPFAAVSVGGNLYIADQVNNAIRVVNSSGTISTFAGIEVAGYFGDNGKATDAELAQPSGIAVDSSGNLYISDTTNCLIRKVTASTGIITTIAGTPGTAGYGGDGGGAAGAFLLRPAGLAFDSAGNLYIADSGNNVIRKVTMSTGIITTYAGKFSNGGSYSGDGAPAINAGLNVPVDVAIDSAGNLYIADSNSNVVRKVSTNLIISTVAGNGTPGFSGDNNAVITPRLAQLSHPKGVAVDAAGNVYIADTLNSRIRVVTPNGATIYTVAGSGAAAYYGDGAPALQAGLNHPAGLSFDGSGNLIIADTGNGVIRKLAPSVATGSKPAISSNGVITADQFGAYSTISPGTWIEIYGTNLAPSIATWDSAFTNGNTNAPTTVGGTTVTVGGLPAYIDYVSPTQVNALVPPGLVTGSQQVVVSTAGGQSNSYSVNVTNTSAGLLAQYTVGGKQYVAAFHQDGTLVMPAGAVSGLTSSPAKAGETITIYGVGFGPVAPSPAAGQLVQTLNTLSTPLSLFFGAAQGALSYSGLAPGYLGLYQFNVVVPTVASNSALPVTFIVGSTNSTQTLYTAVQ